MKLDMTANGNSLLATTAPLGSLTTESSTETSRTTTNKLPPAEALYADSRVAFRASSAIRAVKTEPPSVFGLTGPADYVKKYGRLNQITLKSNLGELFSDGKGKHGMPLVGRTPRLVLPGVSSFDGRFLGFLRKLSHELNDAFPVSVDDELFTDTGIHSTFDKIRSPAGYMQNPMSAKAVDNGPLREELGLSVGYNPVEKEIACEMWNLVWGRALASSVNVPKLSAGGMRRFTHDTQQKLDYARWKTEPTNYDRFLRAVEKGDVLTLANDFEIVHGMYVQKRLQLDSVDKVRLVNDIPYGLSGGKRGKRFPADKRVVIDGVVYDDFAGQRVRNIDAGPWAVNCDLQIVATAHMRSLFDRFPDTFHINTPQEIKTTIDGRYVYCSDVKEFDQSMSQDAIDVVFETMRNWYPEGICRSAERLYEAPYFAKPLDMNSKKSFWSGNPLDWDNVLKGGNRSGHAFTSLVAKVNKVIDTLIAFNRFFPVKGIIEKYLEGSMPMGVINNGDDEIVWAKLRSDITRYAKLREDTKSGHYLIEPEVGQGFSGLLLVRPDPFKPEYFPTPRLQTPFEKMYVPERSIGGAFRQYWSVGFHDRIASLFTSDAGREAWEIHKSVFRSELESHYGSFHSLLAQGDASSGVDLQAYSSVDRAVLTDPDKLHYLYTEDEVSKDVIAKVTSRIPREYCHGFLKRYYSGSLM